MSAITIDASDRPVGSERRRADGTRDRLILCGCCGRPFVAVLSAKGGQPPAYCDADCKAINTALGTLRERWGILRERATPVAWLTLRRTLWSELNLRPWNRGVTRAMRRAVLGRN